MGSSVGSDLGSISDLQPLCSFIEDPNNLDFNKDNFNCGSLNVNSVLCQDRLSQIESIMKNNNIAVFAVQESKLDVNKHPSCYKIDGFNVLAKHRPSGRGGGLLLYIRGDIAFRQLSYLENNTTTMEHISAEIYIQNKRVLINNVYRPPDCDKNAFLYDLSTTIEAIHQNNFFLTVWLGDINAGNNYHFHGSLKTKAIDYEIAEIFEGHCYTQIVDIATRIANYSISLLDVIYLDRYDLVDKAVVFSGVSDHSGTACSFEVSCKRPQQKVQHRFQYDKMNNQNWSDLKLYLSDFKCMDSWSTDEHAEKLSNHLIDGISKFVPKTTFTPKLIDIPWSSTVIRRLLRKKNRLYKCYRKVMGQYNLLSPNDCNYVGMQIRVSQSYDKFRQASKDFKYQSRRAKNSYFNSLKSVFSNPNISSRKKFSIIQKLSNSSKSNFIPSLIENGNIINDPSEKAELFNRHFSAKANVINPSDTPPNLDAFATNDVFQYLDTSHFEIGRIVKSMKDSSNSPCGIPSIFIKKTYSYTGSKITTLISNLLNKIFHTGIYPKIWKVAHITPLFKSNDKSNKANYRPISLLPTLSKICEAVIHKRLLQHLLTNKLITKFQAAYIPSDSTAQQLITMIHQIKQAMASNAVAHGVFLDVSAAFDAVWHSGLLAKLEQLNIKGDVLNLFSSYLSDRRSVTVVEGIKSAELPLNAGVPQGSRLGPLLFLIYINDIVNNLESMPFIYADDTTLLAKGSSTFETTNILSRDLTKISNWAHIWKVKFNPQKSCDMIFSKKLLPSYPVIMDLTIIERVHLHKHLGIYLSSDLSWDKQISHITRKINLKLSLILKVKQLSRQCLDILCKLHIRSTIDYCITVFGPCLNQTQIKKLDSLLYRCGRVVTGALKYTSTNNLFDELGWEATTQRIKLLCLSQFHKIIHKNTTPLIYECLPPFLNARYPTKRTFQFYQCKKTFFEKSFFPMTIKMWDGLPMDLKGLDHPDFKSRLKDALKPPRFRHFNCGYKHANAMHSQLRMKRSFLNSHLHPIGLSITPACKCGKLETVQHFLIDCNLYAHARTQLFAKLDGLLEMKVSKYSKSTLAHILLYGEKPHLSEKYQHNKHIFFSLQRFILQTKRLQFVNQAGHY